MVPHQNGNYSGHGICCDFRVPVYHVHKVIPQKDNLYSLYSIQGSILHRMSSKYQGEKGVALSWNTRIYLSLLRVYTDKRTSFSISLIIKSLSSSSCSSSPVKRNALLVSHFASISNLTRKSISIEIQLWCFGHSIAGINCIARE